MSLEACGGRVGWGGFPIYGGRAATVRLSQFKGLAYSLGVFSPVNATIIGKVMLREIHVVTAARKQWVSRRT